MSPIGLLRPEGSDALELCYDLYTQRLDCGQQPVSVLATPLLRSSSKALLKPPSAVCMDTVSDYCIGKVRVCTRQ